MGEICRRAWQDHGRTPAELFEAMTPSHILAVFFKTNEQPLDRLAELIRHNRERGKRGLKPVTPSWLA